MRSFLASLLMLSITLSVASCELKPGPARQSEPARGSDAPPAAGAAQPAAGSADGPPSPPPPAPAPAAAANPGSAAPPAPPAAGSAAAPAEPTEECLQIGTHIASTLISAADPTQQAQLEQERTKIVRRSAEACTRDAWNAESKACFMAATTSAAMQECGKKLRAP